MLFKTRLPGAILFYLSSLGSKRHMPWFRIIPVLGAVTNEPKPLPCVWVNETMLRSHQLRMVQPCAVDGVDVEEIFTLSRIQVASSIA